MNTTEYQELIRLDSLIMPYPPLESALANWADTTTNPTSDSREDLLHDKTKAVSDFFLWICKPVDQISPSDVKSWQFEIEHRNLAPGDSLCHD
ncbi:MAG: hypothetical protein MUO57_18090 [Anaerolineales bacterium]|nr:hypothetical protein [Anaerolineales bacterium]